MIEFNLFLIFEKSSNIYRFNVYIKNANVKFDKPFKIRFVIMNQNKRCDFCYNEHLIRICNQTISIKLSLRHFCSDVLLKKKPFNA